MTEPVITTEETLTPQMEAFCRYYTQNTNLFGNGTLSYAEAYGFDLDSMSREAVYETDEKGNKGKKIEDSEYDKAVNVCAVGANRLLRKDKIDKRVITLLNEMMDEKIIDARLVEIIKKGDDKDSIQAIREFNKLRQRIIEKKDITSNGKTIAGFAFEPQEYDPDNTDNTTVPETTGSVESVGLQQ